MVLLDLIALSNASLVKNNPEIVDEQIWLLNSVF